MLYKIITECWRLKNIPTCWKTGATILIYKKGSTSDPANFRPISLQPVWYKVFSTFYKNRLYNFLIKNNYIEQNMQKGFFPGCDGVLEHTEQLTQIMQDAKKHSRGLVVTLLDLNNAFGKYIITSSGPHSDIITYQTSSLKYLTASTNNHGSRGPSTAHGRRV